MGTVDVRKWDLVADHPVTYIDMRERERSSKLLAGIAQNDGGESCF